MFFSPSIFIQKNKLYMMIALHVEIPASLLFPLTSFK